MKIITPLEVKALSNQDEFVLVDIRDKNSYNYSHIPGAIHLELENIEQFSNSLNCDQKLIICCYHGVSSVTVANYFIHKGFKDVYSLQGGFSQWQSECSS